jgi:hypothetical protein
MKKFILTLMLILPMFLYSQDIVPYKTVTQFKRNNNSHTIIYSGNTFKISDASLVRVRLYKHDYVQVTYIHKYKKTEYRVYAYVNLIDKEITPALSFRFNF